MERSRMSVPLGPVQKCHDPRRTENYYQKLQDFRTLLYFGLNFSQLFSLQKGRELEHRRVDEAACRAGGRVTLDSLRRPPRKVCGWTETAMPGSCRRSRTACKVVFHAQVPSPRPRHSSAECSCLPARRWASRRRAYHVGTGHGSSPTNG